MDRSGIGLLGELLEAHPNMAITRRINFWDFYAGRYGDLADSSNLDECLTAMMRYTRIQRLEPSVARLKADFAGGDPSYARLFQLLQEQNMERLGRRRWGDKSLGAEHHADEILTAFPQAVMIHALRDPRDRYASQATHRSAGRGGVGSGSAAWLASARRARRNRGRYPERYRVVCYEDLVRDPVAMLTSVCELAELSYSPAMLSTDGEERAIHSESVGRYRTDLTTGEIRFMERVAGTEMRRWGYEPGGTEWVDGEKVRFVRGDLPAAAVGLVLWGPRTKLERLIGGRPSARRTRV